MFISAEEIETRTGIAVEAQVLQLAQVMIEAWVGKGESEIEDAADFATLGRAVMFQSVYLGDLEEAKRMLEQPAVKNLNVGESSTQFDLSMFAPYMSPWAIRTCRKLSFIGSRSIQTGPIFDTARPLRSWVSD